ncbi:MULTISPECIES: 30S ribosomal protein S17 [Dehalococcoides]|jgi:small subunit ribosomal protein S17|uniref:Small ribosomal subunit protein uS17 n=1 Tax=Dehalococcoides mccartyi (strain VS) TaxID=311424 RepID=D2BGY1_DEHMV|nr:MULTISPECIES: 30S ribosomal protein S17 [Dehalococcoides]ACZ61581.1 ribosomal protein S17 [Dehalococcoides mccartyi VS]AHB13192.1 30S ribosomal protein S17 [Dehalococcoides mccartyi GY50]AII57628.1 30S ribosomal protein S17 [Dehalococcoides mccartyi CG1]APH12113.1 30S ribosomal protein S17 [Dehalococcoides mccartyi]QYY58282.1 30S ribosomal protein S17 [Dehalococcoides mccartyi]
MEKNKTRIGHVISDKMEKTIVVGIDVAKRHPLYKKTYRRTMKYLVHDEKNEAKIGDMIEIVECRPISKGKYWRLSKIITKGHIVAAQEA